MYRAGVAVTVRPTFLYTAVLDAVPGAKSKSDRWKSDAAPLPPTPDPGAITYHARQHPTGAMTHGLFEFVGTRPRRLIPHNPQTRSARSCPDRRACTPRYAQHVLVADPARPRPLMAQPSHFPRARPRAPTREPSREPRMTLRNLGRAPPFTEGSLWRAGSTFCEQGLCEHFRESSPAHLTRASWARLSRP